MYHTVSVSQKKIKYTEFDLKPVNVMKFEKKKKKVLMLSSSSSLLFAFTSHSKEIFKFICFQKH